MKKCISILLCICIICGFSGCNRNVSSLQLAKAGSPALTFEKDEITDLSKQVIGFSAEIFRHTAGEENSLISPVSLLYALSMTANGADGQTLADFQRLTGTDIETLNRYLATFKNSLPQTAKAKLNMANAIWFRDSFNANQQFLDKNRDYYGAGIYKAPFDNTTVEDINNFAKENTGGQIDRILENIPAETVMYLVNALSFDSKWEDKYKKSQIHDGIFTAYNGDSQTVKMMYSEESVYIEDENTTGFVKDYDGGKYRFVALLPDENTDIIEYVKKLDGEKLTGLLNTVNCPVDVTIPQFEVTYRAEMKDILTAAGLGSFFDPVNADFSNSGSARYNLYISSVVHKTTLTLDDNGTKAAAITIVSQDEAAEAPPDDLKVVRLDRPFVYMIVEGQTNIPVFIGTVMTIE